MQLTQFSSQHLRSWADYSGDFNPIHFDPEIAGKVTGNDDVVIHGMLAMMHLKRASCVPGDDGKWVQWHAMLRQAMPLQQPYQIVSEKKPGAAKMRTRLEDLNGQLYMSALTQACEVPEWHETTERFALATDTAFQRLQECVADFPVCSPAWIALDAMMFSRYVQEHGNQVFHEDFFRHIGPACADDLAAGKIVVMQTTHSSLFAQDLRADTNDLRFSQFEYAVHTTDYLQTNNGLVLTVEVPVWLDGKLCFIQRIGLMLRQL